MADFLEISLLGGVTIKRNGEPVKELTSRKAMALFIYLACHHQRAFPRETLADLFYSDLPQQRAMANLRVLLHRLGPLATDLHVTRQTVGFSPANDYWLDVTAFEQQLAVAAGANPTGTTLSPTTTEQLAAALALYQGDFLAGFHLAETYNFEEWVVVEQERLHRLAVEALGKLAGYYLDEGQYQAGVESAAHLLQLDPLSEEAHRQMMALLAQSGQRSAALAQYERCRQILADELGVGPSSTTIALYEHIQTMALREQFPAKRPHNLPCSISPFVGRATELAQLRERLFDPGCRLLTLVGLGGIGKTCLALQIAHQLVAEDNPPIFRNGIYFVFLAAVSAPELMAAKIADALKFSFHGPENPERQLIDYLSHTRRDLLLILDSFEHLLPESKLVVEMLERAPLVKIMAVSRERLNVPGEWLFKVRELNYPAREVQPENLEDFSAIQLFAQTARRIQPGFSLSAAEQPFVMQICQLVEGMPLAIELAAAWLRVLSCREIAQEIRQNLDFLSTTSQQVAERHRSLRAVFDHTWRLLPFAERGVFARLSVFRGEFDRRAAAQVAGATLPMLGTLADKSLLRRNSTQPGSFAGGNDVATRNGVATRNDAGTRYEMHDLLQRYAAEKMAQTPAEQIAAQNAHCHYYAHFLRQKTAALKGGQQREALQAINLEIENVRAAWNWAIAHGCLTEIGQALESLFHFYDMRSWFREGEEAFGRAAAALIPPGRSIHQLEGEAAKIAGMLQARQGWFNFHLGQHALAQEKLQNGLALLRGLGAQAEMVFCLNYLAAVQRHLGEYTPARQALAESLAICRELDDRFGASIALNLLGQIASLQGEYGSAQTLCQEALALKREIGDRWGMTYSLAYLGRVAEALGDYAAARDLFLESLAIYHEIDDRRGIAFCCQNLGDIFKALAEYNEAKRLYQEALTLFQEIGHQLGMEQVTHAIAALERAHHA
ncbi:MAG: tetratricopeptide repeat protein [Anaerolineae bacterium]|nr:tetratricopeptide repeat protein [Anaerolineae bacterium]